MKFHAVASLSIVGFAFISIQACGGTDGTDGTDRTRESGGTGSSSNSSPAHKVSGAVVDGAVRGAEVRVYAIKQDGGPGELLAGPVQTSAEGNYSLSVAAEGPVIVVSSGGSFVDWATKGEVTLSSNQKLQAVSPGGASDETINVTPLTSMAAALAAERIREGANAAAAVSQANDHVQQHFGVKGIIGTAIPDLTRADGASGAPRAAVDYALVLGGISMAAATLRVAPHDLVSAAARDCADGRFDGKAGSAQLTLSTASGTIDLPATTFTSELKKWVTDFQSSPSNASGQSGSQELFDAFGSPEHGAGTSGGSGTGTSGGTSATDGGTSATDGGTSATDGGGGF